MTDHRPATLWLAVSTGEGLVEYALLLAFIAVIILLGVSTFGNAIYGWFQTLLARITVA